MHFDDSTLRALQLNLIHYGLDPSEWELRHETANRWTVQHQHQELRLIGETAPGRRKGDWSWLEWVN